MADVNICDLIETKLESLTEIPDFILKNEKTFFETLQKLLDNTIVILLNGECEHHCVDQITQLEDDFSYNVKLSKCNIKKFHSHHKNEGHIMNGYELKKISIDRDLPVYGGLTYIFGSSTNYPENTEELVSQIKNYFC